MEPETLAELKQRYDALLAHEQHHREELNRMRRALNEIARMRKAAYKKWKRAECELECL